MIFRVPVIKTGGGYLKAILNNGEETIFGRDEVELAARLRVRTHVLRANPVKRVTSWTGKQSTQQSNSTPRTHTRSRAVA